MEIKIRFFDTLHKKLFTSDQCNSYEVWDLVLEPERFKAMLYTGLETDGEEKMCEGDVLEDVVNKKRYLIEWDEYGGMFLLKKLWNLQKGEDVYLDFYELDEVASRVGLIIVGDMYSNPDLLNVDTPAY